MAITGSKPLMRIRVGLDTSAPGSCLGINISISSPGGSSVMGLDAHFRTVSAGLTVFNHSPPEAFCDYSLRKVAGVEHTNLRILAAIRHGNLPAAAATLPSTPRVSRTPRSPTQEHRKS